MYNAVRHLDASGRPTLDAALARFVQDLAAARPAAFGHLAPEAILFVAGAARREARASIRPLRFPGGAAAAPEGRKPDVRILGAPVLYEVCLRPRFFLAASPEARGRILAHELWHVSPAFDGSLAADRRHGPEHPEGALDAALTEALDGFEAADTALGPLLAHVGELRLRAWASRPPSVLPPGRGHRLRYTEADLFSAVVIQR